MPLKAERIEPGGRLVYKSSILTHEAESAELNWLEVRARLHQWRSC